MSDGQQLPGDPSLPPGVSSSMIDRAMGDYGDCSRCGEPLDDEDVCSNEDCDDCNVDHRGLAAEAKWDSAREGF